MRGRGLLWPGWRGSYNPAFVIGLLVIKALAGACCLIIRDLNWFLSRSCMWNTHARRDQLFSLLNAVILCHLMGTGSSVPRVPLDNWLLPHLLTSPPLTFLHFTSKVLHFFCTPEPRSFPLLSLWLLTFNAYTCLPLLALLHFHLLPNFIRIKTIKKKMLVVI